LCLARLVLDRYYGIRLMGLGPGGGFSLHSRWGAAQILRLFSTVEIVRYLANILVFLAYV